MWTSTPITEALSIRYPIIQAGMAGGHTTPELVSAVSNAGGLGTIGGGYMEPEALSKSIQAVRKLTNKPFAVNLFIPESPSYSVEQINDTGTILAPIAEKLKMNRPEYEETESIFEIQFNVLIEERVPVFSFTFGVPDESVVQRCQENNIFMIGTATTVKEGQALVTAGAKAIVAQGYEAGGHKGSFLGSASSEGIGTMALVSQMTEALSVPVIASGGIMNGKGILASLSLGAAAAQMGTAFLTTAESGTDDLHKQAILSAVETDIYMTKAFSGKWARGIENEMMRMVAPSDAKLAPYPITNQMTQPIRKRAKELRNKEYMSLWAGQAVRLSEENSVGDLMAKWVNDIDTQLNKWMGRE